MRPSVFFFSAAVAILLIPRGICAEAEKATDLAAKGSHQLLIDRVGASQKKQFKESVAAYDQYVSAHPEDSLAAIERCLFISYFVYSEDFYIDEAAELLEKAKAYLKKFEHEPTVELYRLDQTYGEKAIKKGEALLKDDEIEWSDSQLSKIHVKLASQYSLQSDVEKAGEHALESMDAEPSVQAQLLVAAFYQATDDKEKGITVLLKSLPDEQPFQKKQRMLLLSEFGATKEALKLLRILSKEENPYLRKLEAASILTENGLLDEARTQFKKAKEEQASSVIVAKKLFEFEIQHGSAEEASQAYSEMRDQGYSSDPILYHRFQLMRKDPSLAWQFRDMLGLLSLFAICIAACLVPLCFLVPAHYWGLLRHRAGKTGIHLSPAWIMRHAWAGCGFFLLTGVVISYLFSYEAVFDRLFDEYAPEAEMPSNKNLAMMVLASDFVLLIGIGLIAGLKKSSHAFGSGNWSVGQSLGLAIACLIPLRFFAGILSAIWGASALAAGPEISVTLQSFHAILEQHGPLFLILCIAIITPVVEEIIFRGLLLTSLVRHIPFWPANLLQATLFMVMHEDVQYFPFLFAFGLVTGVLRQKSDSLLSCTLLHAANNGIVAMALISGFR